MFKRKKQRRENVSVLEVRRGSRQEAQRVPMQELIPPLALVQYEEAICSEEEGGRFQVRGKEKGLRQSHRKGDRNHKISVPFENLCTLGDLEGRMKSICPVAWLPGYRPRETVGSI